MGVVFDIFVLVIGLIGIFGIGFVYGLFFKTKIDWSLLKNEDNKKISF